MIELRGADLQPGDTFAEWGMEPVIAGIVTAHGDTVLITGVNGEAVGIDCDTVVELLHRARARRGAD